MRQNRFSVSRLDRPDLLASSTNRAAARRSLSRWRNGVSLPALLLVLSLSYVFIFGENRDRFHWRNDWSSSNNMAVAANLSPDHNFLGFLYRFVGRSGDITYASYNRFPIGAAVLTKLAIAPFEGDLSASILAAKILSVLLFCGSAILSYLALSRLFSDRWGAAAATLLAFSGFYALQFADLVGEGAVSLFGIMLTFHGLAVFVQDGRLRQLLGKTFAAILLGWHVTALVLAFVALSLAAAAVRRARKTPGPRVGRIVLYGGLSFVFAVLVLSLNFFLEYRTEHLHPGGERTFANLPSVTSALDRTGLADGHGLRNIETASKIARRAVARVGEGSIPVAFFDTGANRVRGEVPNIPLSARATGFVVLFVAGAGLFFVRHGIVAASFVLSGFVWGAIAPFNLVHHFESMFYIPVSIVFYFLIARLARRAIDTRFTSVLCFMWAAAIFGASNVRMSGIAEATLPAGGGAAAEALRSFGGGRGAAAVQKAVVRDFDAVRAIMPRDAKALVMTGTHSVHVIEFSGARSALYFYLSGYVVNHLNQTFGDEAGYRPDFVVSRRRFDSPFLLTPENDVVFLYDGAAVCEAAAATSQPNSERILLDNGLEFPCGR